MSDTEKKEMRELLNNIRENGNRVEDNNTEEEPGRTWSREDIDKLLELTQRHREKEKTQKLEKAAIEIRMPEADAGVEEKTAVHAPVKVIEKPEKTQAIDISLSSNDSASDNGRLKAIMTENNQKPKKSGVSSSLKAVKNKFSKLFAADKSNGSDDDFDEEEERFFLEGDGFDDEDELITKQPEKELTAADDKTKQMNIPAPKVNNVIHRDDNNKTQEVQVYIEKPGIVIKKGETQEDSDLEGAPIIMSADEALKVESETDEPDTGLNTNSFRSQLSEAVMDGQMVLNGFESIAEKPEQIDEYEAEQALFEKRREKINKFTLFGDDVNIDPYGLEEDSEKIGELFDAPAEKPKRHESEEFLGIEYSQTKDSRRVMRYLTTQKKKTARRLIALGVLTLFSLIVGIASASSMTASGDRILSIFLNMLIIASGLVVSNQVIVTSFENLKKKKLTVNTAVSLAAIICFFQNLLMLVLYFFNYNTVSVFSGTGLILLGLSELKNYITYSRTIDAMQLCTGENKDKLYSIEGISDDKDALELGKNVKSSSPRIRFSCKTRFPAHLIELCMGTTSADKMMSLMLPLILIMGIINLAVAWLVQGNFTVGFASFTITLSMCVPAYGALLIQLPLRWINKKFNREGGMISSQESVEELCRTNAIILDSKELFDQSKCVMHGFKDFKNVRLDDAMLYAAAMVIRSGGPLTGVFDQMVINRRDILPTVKSFNYEEKLGVSGWIYGQKVVLGNKSMMLNHNVTIPETVDEDRYLINGHEVIYLAIAHKLAAMIVVDYAPDKKIAPYLKKLRDSGVTILVRNCDPNVTEKMISGCYDMRLDNIRIINSAAGRVFKKYKSRPKVAAKASAIHDGTTYTFISSLCTVASLRSTFKIANMLTVVGIVMGFAIVLTLSLLNVIENLPAIFIILMEAVVAAAFSGVMKVMCSK